MEVLWLLSIISGHGGLIPSFQSGCLGGSGRSGIGTAFHLREATRRRYSPRHCRDTKRRYPEQLPSCSRYNWPGKSQVMKHDVHRLRVFAQWALGLHEAWAYGPRGLGARSQIKGLGSWAVPLGRSSGPKWAWGPLCYTMMIVNGVMFLTMVLHV